MKFNVDPVKTIRVFGGHQWIFKFENQFGLSIILNDEKLSGAVIHFPRIQDDNFWKMIRTETCTTLDEINKLIEQVSSISEKLKPEQEQQKYSLNIFDHSPWSFKN